MFKVNNKDTRTTPMTYFTPCYSVSVVNFEHVIISNHVIKLTRYTDVVVKTNQWSTWRIRTTTFCELT